MAELKEDIDKAAERYVKEIMKIQYKKDARKKKDFMWDLESFKMHNIERTKKKYGSYR